MKCPECKKSDVWDNVKENDEREINGEKLRPDYSCKDKEVCGWVKWRPKEGKEILVETHKPRPLSEIKNDPYLEGKKDNNRLICRTDLMSAVVNKLGETTTTQDMKQVFNDLWEEIEK